MARPDLLKLRSLGDRDYSMLQGRQRIGRIRYASERSPPVWIWNVTIHLTSELPIGSAQDLETAKAEFRAAWEALKTRTPPAELAAAFKATRRVKASVKIRTIEPNRSCCHQPKHAGELRPGT
jgi:hypothetical protein